MGISVRLHLRVKKEGKRRHGGGRGGGGRRRKRSGSGGEEEGGNPPKKTRKAAKCKGKKGTKGGHVSLKITDVMTAASKAKDPQVFALAAAGLLSQLERDDSARMEMFEEAKRLAITNGIEVSVAMLQLVQNRALASDDTRARERDDPSKEDHELRATAFLEKGKEQLATMATRSMTAEEWGQIGMENIAFNDTIRIPVDKIT